MNGYHSGKKYESLKILARETEQHDRSAQELPRVRTDVHAALDGPFYVIDYDLCEIQGAGKFVLKSQKIEPAKDPIRERFHAMRDLARADHSPFFSDHRFYHKRIRQDNARIFYRQGIFMQDFSDTCTENAPFSSYYPYYQLMGYEQLRTYFAWRTEVRQRNVKETSLSYAFLYIYELLNNIGVEDPQDGLNRLLFFWQAFRVHNRSVDKYVLRWLKDYHIFYPLPQTFNAFVKENNLSQHYPKMPDPDEFSLFCAISRYDIRKSAFFRDENIELIKDCFRFVINALKQNLISHGVSFDDALFQPEKKLTDWQPFQDALFYPWLKQADRQIVLSENEIYICKQNSWSSSTVITSESGRQLIGYIFKKMESVLRRVKKHPHRLSANLDALEHPLISRLEKSGLSLEKIISDAAVAFYREETRTVVCVDHSALSRIRQEALATQEKLTVPEQEPLVFLPVQTRPAPAVIREISPVPAAKAAAASLTGGWLDFKTALNRTELAALAVILQGEADIKQFADENGIMLEVLADGINEKAMDYIGDSLLDNDFVLYDDYISQVKEIAG